MVIEKGVPRLELSELIEAGELPVTEHEAAGGQLTQSGIDRLATGQDQELTDGVAAPKSKRRKA
jgi:hypothetical protein